MTASPSSLKLVRTIPLPESAVEIDHMGIDVARNSLFVSNTNNDTMEVVNLDSGDVVQVSGQDDMHSVSYAPELDRIFVR